MFTTFSEQNNFFVLVFVDFLYMVVHRHLIVGGGAPEIEVALGLAKYSRTLVGAQAMCVRMFGEALEVIPSTLAENAGLNPIETVTELRNRHAAGEVQTGINVKKGTVSNIFEEHVVQPLLVTTSCIQLASETVRSILKIDDIVSESNVGLSTTILWILFLLQVNGRG